MFRFFPVSLLLCVLSFGSSVASLAQTSTSPTVISVGTTVQQSGVKRLGINLGGQQYFDSRQIMNNLLYRNPGFEGEIWQSIIHCKVVTANSCTDDKASASWPANFFAGGTVEFIAGSIAGAKADITSSAAAIYTSNLGVQINFSADLNPAVGDYMVARMTAPGNAQAGWSAGVSAGGTVTTEFNDLSPNTIGKQAVRMTAPTTASSAGVISYFDSSPTRSFVQLNGTYTLSFRAKLVSGGTKSMYVGVSRIGGGSFISTTPTLTNAWQDFSLTFKANEVGAFGTVKVAFNTSGGTVLLDDVCLAKTRKSNNPTAFRDEVVDTLRDLNPGVIRYMDNGTNWGSSINNMLTPTMARQRAGYSNWNTESDDIAIGLHEFLVLCQTVGAEPWYTMPASMSVDEMKNLMDYLGGSTSTVYGARRAALGQTQPWTSVFSGIHLEFGNEVWNVLNPGSNMSDSVAYGTRAGVIFGTAKASPSYSPVIDLVLDGWESAGAWTKPVLAASSNYDTISQAAYYFGPFIDDSSNEAVFGGMFSIPEQTNSMPGGTMVTRVSEAKTAKVPAKTAIYEANLGSSSGTVPQSSLDKFLPSLGAGISTTENLLLLMRDQGIVNMTMFSLTQFGSGWKNTATGAGGTTPLWATTVDMGGQTNLRRPAFLAEQLANQGIKSVMLAATQGGNNPTWDQVASNGAVPVKGVHYIQSFAFTDGTSNSILLFNLSRTTALPVTFTGSNAPRGEVAVSTLTSASIADTNETTENVRLTSSSISSLDPSVGITLPPYSMTLLTSAAPTIASLGISCAPTAVQVSKTAQCSSAITGNGTFSSKVTWTATAGSISSAGLFTAPATVTSTGEVTITATSVQDPTKTATQTIPVAIPVSGVTVSCATSAMQLSATNACLANVSGTAPYSSAVTWSASAGSVDKNGVVTSPTSAATIVVKATSVQDPTKSGSYTITAAATPVFSNLVVSNVTASSVTVSWTTNIPTQAGLDYGPGYATVSFNGSAPYTTTPSITLTGLTPSTTYKMLIFGYSKDRTFGSAMSSFTTAGGSVAGVTVTCASPSVQLQATDACQATVTGGTSTSVVWSATGGTVTQAGLVTAPAAAGTIVVKATSTQDSTKVGSFTISAVAPAITSIAISCATSTLQAGGSTLCSSTITGTGAFSSAVRWSATSGSLSAAGLYSAPASVAASQKVTITATSTQDSTKTAALTITLAQPSAVTGVSVSCASSSVSVSATDACQATVAGTGAYSSAVTWSTSAGSVTSAGLLTAPASAGTIVVRATSTQDSTKVASFTVTASAVNTPPSLSGLVITALTPTSVTLSWKSNVPVQTGIQYGPSTLNTSIYSSSSPYTTNPTITLTGLTPGTYYKVLPFGYSTSRAFVYMLNGFTTPK